MYIHIETSLDEVALRRRHESGEERIHAYIHLHMYVYIYIYIYIYIERERERDNYI